MPAKQRKQAQQPNLDDAELAPQERITQQLVRQLKPHLPIRSVETITEKMEEIEIHRHRFPLRLFAPFIDNDLFPIESAEELEQKLNDGVRRAIALAESGFISVGNPSLIEILSVIAGEPRGYASLRSPARNLYSYNAIPASGSTTDPILQDKGGR
jgi:hypothetical protein